MMAGKLRHKLRRLQEGNYDYFLTAISWRLPNWLFHYYHSYLLKSDNVKLLSRKFTTYYKKFIAEEDSELLEKNGYPRALVLSRLNAGDRGIIMGKDDEITSIIWATTGKRFLKLSGGILDPGDDGIILYGAQTKEYARLKGLFPSALSELYNTYMSEGRSRIYSIIDVLNTNSLNIHKRMNFEIIGETVYIILFGIGICFYKSWPFQTKKIHIFIKKPPHNLEWV